jgi:predicted nucleotidyltransferase
MANESSSAYRFKKMIYALEKIHESGLIEFLEAQTTPKAIVLFGSFAKAEFDKSSDIDLFIQAQKQPVSLDKYEKALKHKISLLFEPEPKKMSAELRSNIINGIKLGGYLKVP